MKVVLATRKSPLALWQAEEAARLLRAADPTLEVELLEVTSSGDADRQSEIARFGAIGVFTVEVDRAVLDGRAHAAVHSLKDLPSQSIDGMRLAGALPRGPVEDAWICPSGATLEELPAGARVATGSMRRRAMLRAQRPELKVVGLRGNVDTRLAKLDAGEADAIVLARAGLVRLGLERRITQVLDPSRFVPAAGQGIVGLTCRDGDDATHRRLHGITDLEAFDEGRAERGLLSELRGGCNVPVGAHARVVEGALSLRACVLSLEGDEVLAGEVTGSRDQAAQLGRMLARDLLDRGAGRLIERAREA